MSRTARPFAGDCPAECRLHRTAPPETICIALSVPTQVIGNDPTHPSSAIDKTLMQKGT